MNLPAACQPCINRLAPVLRWLAKPRVIFLVWLVVSIVAVLMKGPLQSSGAYNNFLVFRGVFDHLFSAQPLYELYPLEYHDQNHYGPVFGFLIAPFTALPVALALPLWVIGMALLLYWAVRKLPLPVLATSLILWITVNDLYSAELLQQFNIAVAALLIGTLDMIERRKEGWAALFIVAGTLIKVYNIVGLAFFFFVYRKWRFVFFMLLWSAVALLLPLIVVSPEYLISQYSAWVADLAAKNGANMFCDYTNISITGFVRKVSGSPGYSDLWIMIPAVLLFLVSYVRVKQYRNVGFRLTMLASLLLFIVLFSSGSETSGYVIAATGVGIWWTTLPRHGVGEWGLLLLMLIGSFAYCLFSRDFYNDVFVRYAMRSLPYFLVWLHCIWRLWLEDFTWVAGRPGWMLRYQG